MPPQTRPNKASGQQDITKGPNSEPGQRSQHPERPLRTDSIIDTHTQQKSAAEERETAFPTCKYAHNDKTQRKTRALTHPNSGVVGLKEKADNQPQNHTTITPTDTHTRTTASTRGSYHWCPKEGDNSDDPTPLSLLRCHTTKAHRNPHGAPDANRWPYSAPQGNLEGEYKKPAPPPTEGLSA